MESHKRSGRITFVQRMSLHDGPGIRSTVFMKGCNLRCRWCHNPETWDAAFQLQYIGSKCLHCLTCAGVCPVKAIVPVDGRLYIERNLCNLCGKCAERCPGEALSVVGRDCTPEGLLNEVLKDRIFYDISSGGVTVSGGEPLMQDVFVREFLTLCKANSIHTAVETNLNIPWTHIEPLLPYTDLWMCDIKVFDTRLHEKWTGSSNALILENIRKLCGTGAEIIVRTPVVPGVNDSEEEIGKIASYLSEYKGDIRYELLPFHTLGFEKFDNLGMGNPMAGAEPVDRDRLGKLKKFISQYGF